MKNCLYWFIIFFLYLAACTQVPITQRSQLHIFPEQTLIALSLTSYQKFLQTHRLSTDLAKVQMVKSVGKRLAQAVTTFFQKRGESYRLQNYHWEFNLVENKAANAWCMPGGKVVVYTGILPLTKNQAGLAVVLGHEIAHAVAQHGNERLSQLLLFQLGGMALSAALAEKPAKTKELFLIAYGLGGQLGVLLPYSREQELEADRLGLIFMAMAGYDPREAITFWQRMSRKHQTRFIPEFLSTHPLYTKRIEQIKKFMPTALRYYRSSPLRAKPQK